MVAGLQPGCGVLELKSRLQAYGPIARARVDGPAATGYVTFRSGAAAVAAIDASLDPDGGITIGSKKVLVVPASEAPKDSKGTVRSSHDTMVKTVIANSASPTSKVAPGVTYKAREIVAYDDLFKSSSSRILASIGSSLREELAWSSLCNARSLSCARAPV
ncbi:hypothetical protein BS78_03G295100 [Paspalum vaginatum]|nr:hypothetical protein BS78_03G295100 [Paspalum vaginatum]